MTTQDHRRDTITVLDLFAGCGGLTEGFHQYRPSGGTRPVFRSIGAVEWDPAAAATYAANFGARSLGDEASDPPEILCRDIVGWEPKWVPGDVDVVVGGPPCQGFSGLNREKVRAERNTLWQEFIRVVVALQPKVFVIENVDRFLRSAEFKDLKERVGGSDLGNYRLVDPGSAPGDTEWQRDRRYLLNAADYGTRQARRRAIVMGVRTDAGLRVENLDYPKPTHSRAVLRPETTGTSFQPGIEGELLWNCIDELFAESASMSIASDLPLSELKTLPGVAGMFPGPFHTTDLHIGRKPEAISLSRYRAIPRGGNRKNLRGRYACRFGDSDETIIEKVGAYRRDNGTLNVHGAYVVVIDGARTSKEVSVRSIDSMAESDSAGGRRSKSEKFRAVVVDGASERNAELEYLSTPSWDDHDAGSGDVMGRMRAGEPSVTIRTEFFKPEKGRYLHPTEDRPITHFEAARLQGFPDHFKWHGTRLDIAKQIGNAVPVPLGRRIAESIYVYLTQ